jgi:ribosomal protein L3
VEQNHVVEVKTEEKHGYNALKIGAGGVHLNRMSRAQMGICAHVGVPPKRWFMEFKVSADATLPVGMLESGRYLIFRNKTYSNALSTWTKSRRERSLVRNLLYCIESILAKEKELRE